MSTTPATSTKAICTKKVLELTVSAKKPGRSFHGCAPASVRKQSSKTPAFMATPHAKCSINTAATHHSANFRREYGSERCEDWIEQQCEAFKQWMNYMFNPTEDSDHEKALQQIEDGTLDASSVSNAALRTLILHQRTAQARLRASDLYKSPDMTTCVEAITTEVKRGKLALRQDQDIYANLSLRGKVLELLLSYSTPWLRIGLEAVFGETISPHIPNHNSPRKVLLSTHKRGRRQKVSCSF